ncbi:MAG: ribosome maturation factor RimP [Leptolyngbyaceae bacterium]|nr:ribosome maturation factor RimP [Leptolyngbyaceae bacterium]
MPHPLIPQIIETATPVAHRLGFDVVDAAFHTNQSPPVLRIDIRHASRDITLDDCEAMSRALDAVLDETNIIPDAYVLEISSAGISRVLSTDRDFVSFKGFPVTVITHEPFRGDMSLTGQLIKRDDESVQLNCKGRSITIPRHIINRVQFADPS